MAGWSYAKDACSPATRKRSRARSVLRRVASRRLDQAPEGCLHRLAIGTDGLPTNHRAVGPAADGLALVRAERVAVEEVVLPDDILVGKVDQPQVCVVSCRDDAFFFKAESA